MIYLQPGKQDFEYPETKKKSVLTWKAGEAKWSPAGGKHIAEIVSDQPVTIVEVELKKPGDPAKKATGPLDPVKLDPKDYKVVFENDQVRVLHVKIGAGKSTPGARTQAQSRSDVSIGSEDQGHHAGREEHGRRRKGGRSRLGRSGKAQGRKSEYRAVRGDGGRTEILNSCGADPLVCGACRPRTPPTRPQQAPQQHQLPDVIRVVVGHQQRLPQQRLAVAVSERL